MQLNYYFVTWHRYALWRAPSSIFTYTQCLNGRSEDKPELPSWASSHCFSLSTHPGCVHLFWSIAKFHSKDWAIFGTVISNALFIAWEQLEGAWQLTESITVVASKTIICLLPWKVWFIWAFSLLIVVTVEHDWQNLKLPGSFSPLSGLSESNSNGILFTW